MSELNRNTSSAPSHQGGGNRSRNRNRNRSRNRSSQGQGAGRGERREGEGSGRSGERVRRTPQPKPLTFWQKILKAVGLYRPEGTKKNSVSTRQSTKPAESRREPLRAKKTARARQKPRQVPDSSTVDGTRLYIGNLSYDAGEHDLEDLFKGVGMVRKVEIVYNRQTHRSKGYGFVEMGGLDEAKRAVEVLHDQPFMGRTLIVNGARSAGPIDQDEDAEQSERAPREDSVNPDQEEVVSLAPRVDPDQTEAEKVN